MIPQPERRGRKSRRLQQCKREQEKDGSEEPGPTHKEQGSKHRWDSRVKEEKDTWWQMPGHTLDV